MDIQEEDNQRAVAIMAMREFSATPKRQKVFSGKRHRRDAVTAWAHGAMYAGAWHPNYMWSIAMGKISTNRNIFDGKDLAIDLTQLAIASLAESWSESNEN